MIDAIKQTWSTKNSVERLIQELNHDDPGMCFRACWALSQIGEEAAPAIPALLNATHQAFPFVREAAATALGRIQQMPEICVPRLGELLQDKDWRVRGRAAE